MESGGAINLMEASYNYCKCWMTLKLRKPETLRYCSQSIFREAKIALKMHFVCIAKRVAVNGVNSNNLVKNLLIDFEIC